MVEKPEQQTINALAGLYRSGRFAEAETQARELLQAFPEDFQLNDILAGTLIGQRKVVDAIAAFRRIIELRPGFAEAHCDLGNALAESGQIEEAIESFRKAIELKSDFAEAHNMLGMALKAIDRLDEAAVSYRRAIELKPGFIPAYNNLATVCRPLNRLEESIAACRTALEHDPRSAEAYYNLGAALQLEGQKEAACEAYEKAIELGLDLPEAHNAIGGVLRKLGRLPEAIAHFDSAGYGASKAWALECCYELGRVEEFRARLEDVSRSDPTIVRVASISAFATQQMGMDNPYPFCRNPLDYIDISNVKSQLSPFEDFSARLVKAIDTAQTVWEPPGYTTVKGHHTMGNLFAIRAPEIGTLLRVIAGKIDDYRSRYRERTETFITNWPKHCTLTGWQVQVAKGGYQKTHNHPGAWLSGVLYVTMPEHLDGDEGGIAFTLRGPGYRVLDPEIPEVRFSPGEGDLVLFPSSLFHFTIPIRSDGVRRAVAFDLCPRR